MKNETLSVSLSRHKPEDDLLKLFNAATVANVSLEMESANINRTPGFKRDTEVPLISCQAVYKQRCEAMVMLEKIIQ